ncbi:hypothetical protein SFRURICE_018610 [Spodoptera frugiperda]|nr:hypothetical protein SFRURICE_018610 [Spodoptera frugiperda]
MKAMVVILIIMLCWAVEGSDRTNLAILLAAKVGLYKLVLAIALTVASLKILLIMVWATVIYTRVPDPYLHYQKTEPFPHYHDKFSHHREGYQTLDLIAGFIQKRQRRY